MRAINRGSDVVIGSPSFALSAWVNAGRVVNASDRGSPPSLFFAPFLTFARAHGFIIYASIICTGCDRYKWKHIIIFFLCDLYETRAAGQPSSLRSSRSAVRPKPSKFWIIVCLCLSFSWRTADPPAAMTADSMFETTSIPGHLAPTPQRLERLLSKQTLEELYEVEEQPFAR